MDGRNRKPSFTIEGLHKEKNEIGARKEGHTHAEREGKDMRK